MALLRFKQTYLGAGFELDDAELPDHLCVVLEFAATIDRDLGRDLMLDHRAGLELLRLSLRDMGSRWVSLIDAITATLPPLRGDERDAYAVSQPRSTGGRSGVGAIRRTPIQPGRSLA